ncbi:hypothetical protein KAX97_08180 [candidate division WOR-3 bacterium]|nr:hypothetical protein [candidate division WOR-3 bacterium]
MKYNRSIAIIEPHFDDAWLNLGGFILLNPNTLFKILTVSKCEDWNKVNHTAELSKILPNVCTLALNYDSISVPRTQIEGELDKRDIRRVVDEEMKQKGVKSYPELFLHNNDLKEMTIILERIKSFINDADAVFQPLGLYHPMHIVVSQFQFNKKSYRYSEYPYKFYSSEKENLQRIRLQLKEHIVDISEVVKEKVRIFKSIYTTQRYILSESIVSVRWEELTTEEYFE